MSEADTGVSSSSFYDSSSNTQLTFLFRIFDNIECGSILDTTARVLELSLSKYLASRVVGQSFKSDQGCIANRYPSLSYIAGWWGLFAFSPPTKPLTWPWAFASCTPYWFAEWALEATWAARYAVVAKLRSPRDIMAKPELSSIIRFFRSTERLNLLVGKAGGFVESCYILAHFQHEILMVNDVGTRSANSALLSPKASLYWCVYKFVFPFRSLLISCCNCGLLQSFLAHRCAIMPGRASVRPFTVSRANSKRPSEKSSSRKTAASSAVPVPDEGPSSSLRTRICAIFDDVQRTTASHRKLAVSLRKVQEACCYEPAQRQKQIQEHAVEDDFNVEIVRCVTRLMGVKRSEPAGDHVVKFLGMFLRRSSEQGEWCLRGKRMKQCNDLPFQMLRSHPTWKWKRLKLSPRHPPHD